MVWICVGSDFVRSSGFGGVRRFLFIERFRSLDHDRAFNALAVQFAAEFIDSGK